MIIRIKVLLVFCVAIYTVFGYCGPISELDKIQSGTFSVMQNLQSDTIIESYLIPITNFKLNRQNTQIFLSTNNFINQYPVSGIFYGLTGHIQDNRDDLSVTLTYRNTFRWPQISIVYMVSQNPQFTLGYTSFMPNSKNARNLYKVQLESYKFAPLTQYKANTYISGLQTNTASYLIQIITSEINIKTSQLQILCYQSEKQTIQNISFSYIIYQTNHDIFQYNTPDSTYQIVGMTTYEGILTQNDRFSLCRKSNQSYCKSDEIMINGICYCKDENNREINGKCKGDCLDNQVLIDDVCECIVGYVRVNDACVRQTQCGQNEVYIEGSNLCQCGVGYQLVADACVQECKNNQIRNNNGNCRCKNGYYSRNNVCNIIPQCPAFASFDFITEKCACEKEGQFIVGEECISCGNNQVRLNQECICIEGAVVVEGQCIFCPENSSYNRQDCICNQGYYGDRNGCQKCLDGCQSCSNIDNCLSCIDDTYELYNGKCRKIVICPEGQYRTDANQCKKCISNCKACENQNSCQQCDLGYQFVDQLQCQPLCGDNRKLQTQECDDGNKQDGDGCSNMCQVQNKWECSGGNFNSPSICKRIIKVLNLLQQTFYFSEGVIEFAVFNQPLQCFLPFNDPSFIAEQLISVKVTNDKPYVTPFIEYNVFLQQYQINFIFDFTRDGDMIEYEISINEDVKIPDSLFCFQEIDVNQKIIGSITYRRNQ